MTAPPPTPALRARDGLAYGLLGLPLAFVALPLYVLLPNHYATTFGVPLATLGALLFGARLLDAFVDPLIGRASDHLFARSIRALLAFGGVAALLLAVGFALLFFPATREPRALLLWAGVMLAVTYLAFSTLSIAHQSWGAMLGGDEAYRSRVVSWREAMALAGVLIASVLPQLAGLPAMVGVFAVLLAIGCWAWTLAPRPRPQSAAGPGSASGRDVWLPFRRPAFRRLMVVFVFNGIASSIPATLFLFFVQDRLQAPREIEPAFLGSYFLCAALSIPLWLRAVARFGIARSWLAGMLLAIAVFIWTLSLGAGDTTAFIVVCVLSGVALGTDLSLPSALLAGVIADAGDRGRAEGAYFGWWNFATKLNLALAAGLALPLLSLFGYQAGARDPAALQALAVAYGVLPCVLKLVAAGCLYQFVIRNHRGSQP